MLHIIIFGRPSIIILIFDQLKVSGLYYWPFLTALLFWFGDTLNGTLNEGSMLMRLLAQCPALFIFDSSLNNFPNNNIVYIKRYENRFTNQSVKMIIILAKAHFTPQFTDDSCLWCWETISFNQNLFR